MAATPDPKFSETLLEVIGAQFAKWDADGNGVLGMSELDALAANPQIIGTNAALAAALKRTTRSPKYRPPVLTLVNIQLLITNTPATNQPDLKRLFRDGIRNLLSATNRTMFPAAPKLETIHQGKLGNCFCLAPLGAMLHRDPDQVSSLFAPQPNGNVRVTLGRRTVEVTPPTDTEIAMTSSNESQGIWVNVYEKALGQMRFDIKPADQRTNSALDTIARGGSAGTILSFITSNEITRFSFKFATDPKTTATQREKTVSDLRRQLTAAVREKRLMTCGTVKPTTPGLTANHAYAVLGYDVATDRVTLWNPHGGQFKPKGNPSLTTGYPMKDGILDIPLLDFVRQFSGMSFEQTKTSASAPRRQRG